MRKPQNLVGKTFGNLFVESRIQNDKYHHSQYSCHCICGNKLIVLGGSLLNNRTKSCGCLRKKMTTEKSTKHGLRKTRLYGVWLNIKNRCNNRKDENYLYYGGRGITVCNEWCNDFKTFYDWAMANGYDKNAKFGECTVDRIDVNGDYCPENCRLVNMDIQANNSRKNVIINCYGETLTVAQAAKKYNLSYQCLSQRIKAGWDTKRAIETPIQKRSKTK